MISVVRTNNQNQDFIDLVKDLDIELAKRDGEDAPFFQQYNINAGLNQAVVAYKDNLAMGSGAFKKYSNDTCEIKRMFVPEYARGKGIAGIVLKELEQWALELGYKFAILETGIKMPEAIRLYEKSGYERIPNYDQYAGVDLSVCYKKDLS